MIDVILPLPPISNAVAIDIDKSTGDIYWSDTIEDVVMKASSDGFLSTIMIEDSLDSVDGLAIDSVGRKLYWTDAGRHTIEVSELNGTNRNILHWQELESPRGITLNYEHGYLFWTDWGSYAKIERSEMDGTRRTKLVTANLNWPNSLSIDNIKKRIYWTDAKLNHIQSCDFDGNERRTVIPNLPHPYGLAIGKSHIYWTDWRTSSLHMADKENISNQKVIKNNLEGLMDVKIVEVYSFISYIFDKKKTYDNYFLNQNSSVLENNVCGSNNGGCSHLCLRNTRGFSCKCPTGTKLQENSNTECQLLPNNFLLIALRSGIGRVSLDTQELFDVVLPIEGTHGVVVLDYHFNQSEIYFADVNIDTINVVDMKNLTNIRTIISNGISIPNGIAVDWTANNLYWTDSANKVIINTNFNI